MPADSTTAAILAPVLILMLAEMAVGILILARYRREPSAPALSGYLLLNPIPVLLAAGFGFYEALGHDGQLAHQVGGFLVALTLMAFAASFLIWFELLYVERRASELQTLLIFAPALGIGLAYLLSAGPAQNDINNVVLPVFFSAVVYHVVALVAGAFLLRGRIPAVSNPHQRSQLQYLYRHFFLPMSVAGVVAASIIILDFNGPVQTVGAGGWLPYVAALAGIAIFVAVPPLALGLGLLRGKIFRGELLGNRGAAQSLPVLEP